MADAQIIELRSRDQALEEEARTAARLVRNVRDGQRDAETEMIERYRRGLLYLLKRRTGDRELARDLLQETFCIAIEKLRAIELNNPERLAGYLRGIAVRVALNAVRRRQRQPVPVDSVIVDALADTEPTQRQAISREQERACVKELLSKMPVERDRDLLIRLYVYDQEKVEICEALGLDSLHFNRVLYRAKDRFKKLLKSSGRVSELSP